MNQQVIRQVIELLQSLINDDDSSSESFGEFLKHWLDNYKLPKLKSSTLYNMQRYVAQISSSELGSVPLQRLTGEQLQAYIIENFKGNTQKKIYLVMHGCLEKAVKLRRIMYNPILSVELPSHRVKHYRPLEFEEQAQIVYYYQHAKEYYVYTDVKPMFYLFQFMCCTGLRIGEFLALDWSNDIDFDNQVISVRHNLDTRTGKITTTKTQRSERRVPFIDKLVPIINLLRRYRFTYNSVKKHFDRLYSRLGIKGANIHSFRHTFVSMCYAAGFPAKNIQDMVGHADIGTTLNIYTHLLKKGNSILFDYIKELRRATR